MIDIQLIRQHLETTKDNLSFRGVKLDFNHLLELDEECKKSLIEKQSLEMERNQISKQIGVPTSFGRPNFEKELLSMAKVHPSPHISL